MLQKMLLLHMSIHKLLKFQIWEGLPPPTLSSHFFFFFFNWCRSGDDRNPGTGLVEATQLPEAVTTETSVSLLEMTQTFWVWWWFQWYIHTQIYLHTLNMCSFVHFNHTSIKLTQMWKQTNTSFFIATWPCHLPRWTYIAAWTITNTNLLSFTQGRKVLVW